MINRYTIKGLYNFIKQDQARDIGFYQSQHRRVARNYIERNPDYCIKMKTGYYEHEEMEEKYPYIVFSNKIPGNYGSTEHCLIMITPERVYSDYQSCSECAGDTILIVDPSSRSFVTGKVRPDVFLQSGLRISDNGAFILLDDGLREIYNLVENKYTFDYYGWEDLCLQISKKYNKCERSLAIEFIEHMHGNERKSCPEICGDVKSVSSDDFDIIYTTKRSFGFKKSLYISGVLKRFRSVGQYDIAVEKDVFIRLIFNLVRDDYYSGPQYDNNPNAYNVYAHSYPQTEIHPHITNDSSCLGSVCMDKGSIKEMLMAGQDEAAAIIAAGNLTYINPNDWYSSEFIIQNGYYICEYCEGIQSIEDAFYCDHCGCYFCESHPTTACSICGDERCEYCGHRASCENCYITICYDCVNSGRTGRCDVCQAVICNDCYERDRTCRYCETREDENE